jgi:hypothetical protein
MSSDDEAKQKWESPVADPYVNCMDKCTHDCVPGILVTELIGPHDGPHPDPYADKILALFQNRR